jgi:hypothetical protein
MNVNPVAGRRIYGAQSTEIGIHSRKSRRLIWCLSSLGIKQWVIFLEEDRGHELMWSMGNGMMMHKEFEEGYDEHTFCLLPIENPGQPDSWKLVLIDEEKRFEKAHGSQTWDFYDGRELQFLRPTPLSQILVLSLLFLHLQSDAREDKRMAESL